MRGGVVPGRQLSQLRLRDGRDLRDGFFDVCVGLEEYLHHGDAIKRLRLAVLMSSTVL